MQVVIKEAGAETQPSAEALRQAAQALKLAPVGAPSGQGGLAKQPSSGSRRPFAFKQAAEGSSVRAYRLCLHLMSRRQTGLLHGGTQPWVHATKRLLEGPADISV